MYNCVSMGQLISRLRTRWSTVGDMCPSILMWVYKTRILLVAIVLLNIVTTSVLSRRVSDDERRRKANLIQQYLKKFQKEEGSLRLVGGKNQFEGNVEILHNGKWGAVCDDEWGPEEAKVVCKHLGLGVSLRHSHSAKYGLATRKYWMDNLYCDGSESLLGDCRFDGWGMSDCVPEEAAGVVCQNEDTNEVLQEIRVEEKPKKPKKPLKDSFNEENFKMRIRGGRRFDEGRVEVKYGNIWGTLCGDGWSILEANVVCKSLGLGFAMNAVQTDFFGGNSSTTILSGVQCNGTEESLVHCLHDHLGEVNCPGIGSNLAGVTCVKEMADLIFDHHELMRTAHLEDRHMFALQCAMEENCLGSQAYVIQREQGDWFTQTRRLLRFTASVLNAGTADFRPAIPKHLWEWHMCHMHYHSMEVFATFDIIDSSGRRVAEGHKASFCLEDNTCMPGVEPKYACANYGDQGVSVNCSDIYKFNIDCQWVDISELNPGEYKIKVAVNPEFKVPEMSYENNAASCKLLYTETFATVYDCQLHRP